MFESLSERLDSAFKQLKGEGRISEINVASTVKEIRRALVDADVNYKIAKDFTDRVREKALGEKVITAISPSQLMVKIVKDELAELMGGAEAELDIKSNPSASADLEALSGAVASAARALDAPAARASGLCVLSPLYLYRDKVAEFASRATVPLAVDRKSVV